MDSGVIKNSRYMQNESQIAMQQTFKPEVDHATLC